MSHSQVSTILGQSKFLPLVVLAGAMLVSTSASAIPSGLIHLWEADGNTSDSVGGVTGTLVDATDPYAPGLQGQAFNFNGSTDLFSAAVDIGPSNLPEITFGAWFNIDMQVNNRGWAIGHDNGGFDRSISLFDSRYSGSSKKPAVGVGRTYTSLLDDMLEDTWRFVAVAYNQAAETATVYSEGMSQTILNTSLGDGNSFFRIERCGYVTAGGYGSVGHSYRYEIF